MEYNTQRPLLRISDYGRTVAKMIDYAKQLPTREQRTRMAYTIVGVMTQLNPKIKERTDYQHILWNHLMIMADFALDCDCPYAVDREETEHLHPRRLQSTRSSIAYRHYGRTLQDMIERVAAMPEGRERAQLTGQLAHAMKRQYLQWNRDTVEDSVIAEQLAELSGGRLRLPEGFAFHNTEEVLQAIGTAQGSDPNRKKKKKKKKKPMGNGKF